MPPRATKFKYALLYAGHYLLNPEPIDLDELKVKLHAEKQRDPQSIVSLYADQNARYADIAKILRTIHQSGLGKIGSVTEDAAKD
ncbi:MAG: hypothetical protein CK528_13695 [Alcaligenaceae bacterium]|nr:MAG: hypothetical protein CK528_13695 [Alcaligenaceae bacterium]